MTSASASLLLRKHKIVTEIKIRNKAEKLLFRKYGLYLKGKSVDEKAKEVIAINRLATYSGLNAFANERLAKKIATGAIKKDNV
jgi:hypothetical protein